MRVKRLRKRLPRTRDASEAGCAKACCRRHHEDHATACIEPPSLRAAPGLRRAADGLPVPRPLAPLAGRGGVAPRSRDAPSSRPVLADRVVRDVAGGDWRPVLQSWRPYESLTCIRCGNGVVTKFIVTHRAPGHPPAGAFSRPGAGPIDHHPRLSDRHIKSSSPRKRGSNRNSKPAPKFQGSRDIQRFEHVARAYWIPAFAGMTTCGRLHFMERRPTGASSLLHPKYSLLSRAGNVRQRDDSAPRFRRHEPQERAFAQKSLLAGNRLTQQSGRRRATGPSLSGPATAGRGSIWRERARCRRPPRDCWRRGSPRPRTGGAGGT